MANLRRDDFGRKLVDEQLEDLQEKLSKLYTNATYELDEKLSDYFRKYEKKDAEMLAQLAAGEITDKQYTDWRRGTIIGQESWFNTRDRIAEDLTHCDEMAVAMINETMPSVYSTSYNFGAFMMEQQSAVANVDLSPFTIYNEEAVKILMKDNPDLLPSLSLNRNRDLQWNREHIQTAVAQGIIQGDSMGKIASRLEQVTAMDKNAAMRNARTATNGAENAGRQAVADRCVEQGIPMVKEWNAVLDARTRDSHLIIDGEQREEDEKFSNGLMYAGDPTGEPAEVYNCRCSTLHFIKGIDHSKDEELYEKFMKEEHYDDWLKIKEAEADDESHWHAKNLEQEYAAEKQAYLRGEKVDVWDDDLIVDKADAAENPDDFIAEQSPRYIDDIPNADVKMYDIENMSYEEMRDRFIDDRYSYVYDEQYKDMQQERTELLIKDRELNDEKRELREELKDERTVKPKDEWDTSDEIQALLGNTPVSYTERGEEIDARLSEIIAEQKPIDAKISELNESIDRIDSRNYREQISDWNSQTHTFVEGSADNEYVGFSTTMSIGQFDEDLRNGIGFIAEMSPSEYIDRISYDIFHTTRERALNCNYENVREYARMMAEGTKFDMGYLDYKTDNQEGRHRALAAELLGIEKIPVYIRK